MKNFLLYLVALVLLILLLTSFESQAKPPRKLDLYESFAYHSKDSISGCGWTQVASSFKKRRVYLDTPVGVFDFKIVKRTKEVWLGEFDGRKFVILPVLIGGVEALMFLAENEILILSDEDICSL